MIKDNKIVRTVQSTSQDYERGLKEVPPYGFTNLDDRIYRKHEALEIEFTREIIDDLSIGLVRMTMMVVIWTLLATIQHKASRHPLVNRNLPHHSLAHLKTTFPCKPEAVYHLQK